MPLTQPLKDAAHNAVAAWPSDVPERAPVLAEVDAAVVPVPVPVVDTSPCIITDAPEGITSTHLYGGGVANTPTQSFSPWLAWANKGGDWRDANGQMQGPALFASVSFKVGQTGALALDISSLAKKGKSVQLRLQAAGSTTITLLARRSPTPPLLAVQYEDGTSDQLFPSAEVSSVLSTVYMMVDRLDSAGNYFIEVSPGSAPYLRFELQDKPVKTATLAFTILKAWTAGSVGVLQFDHEFLPQPSSLATWGGDLLFQTDSFLSSALPKYVSEQMYVSPNGIMDRYSQLSQCVDGGPALEIAVDPRQNAIVAPVIGIWPEAEEAWFCYDMKFLAGSEGALIETGKLPGLRTASRPDDDYLMARNGRPFPDGTCGTLLAGNGGSKVDGRNGWSSRGGYNPPYYWADPRHPLRNHWGSYSYIYHPDSLGLGITDYNGEHAAWTAYGYGTHVPEQWYHIDFRLKMNTPDQHDGEIEARIDNKLAYLRKNFMFRKSGPYPLTTDYGVPTNLAIRGLWACAYAGGHALPVIRAPWMRWKNMALYRIS